ncbi:MAG: S8 family serine peptidase [Methanobacteriota archaeon]
MALSLTLLPSAATAVGDDGPGASDGVGRARFVVGFHGPGPATSPGADFHGGRVLAVDEMLGFITVEAPPDRFEARAGADDHVRYVEPDPVLPLLAYVPNDAQYGSTYGPSLIGAPVVWDTTLGSSSVAVCIVDTGVRYTHEDLVGRYTGGQDFVHGDSDPWDDNGHGTHVAGTAVATIDNGVGIAGVARVSLLAAKAMDASGSGAMSAVASSVRWCADRGAFAISMSLGGSSGSSALQDAVEYAWNKGAVIMAAAGNGGPCTNCVLYPARYTNAVAVGCVDDQKNLCYFSATGPEVDLVAPGSGILSAWHTSDTAYARAGGTSMSTPHVAGAAALLKSARPERTNAGVRQALESTAEDRGASGRDDSYGWGLVRVDLAAAASPSPSPSPSPVVRGLSVSPSSQSATVAPKGTVTYAFVVTNTGSAADTLGLSLSGFKGGWSGTLSAAALQLEAGASATVTVTVKAPAKSGTNVASLVATSQADASATAGASMTTTAQR